MQTQLDKPGKGQRKRLRFLPNRDDSSRASILPMKTEVQPALPCQVPPGSFRKEREVAEVMIQSLRSNAREELATLLRDVRAGHRSGIAGEIPSSTSNGLLMRAVRCAAKQYRLQAELGNLAFTDDLTGLYNRRAFQALAERQLKLGRRSCRGMLLFFIDLDGLNRINDFFGHAEGDQALRRTAEILRRTFRDSDVIARQGGDEFAVLAVEAAGHSEATMLRRLSKCVNAINSEHTEFAISLSVGVARFDFRKPVTIADLMAEADKAMYAQKRGRPRSHVAAGGDSPC